MQETPVQFLGGEDAMEKAYPFSILGFLPAMQETWDRSLGWEIPWRRESLPTPVFRPGEFHGLYSSWGHKESDTTE